MKFKYFYPKDFSTQHVRVVYYFWYLLVLVGVVSFGIISFMMLTHRVTIFYGEGTVVYESWLLARGKSFYYHFLHTSNIVLVCPYPPLFQLISSILIKAGIKPLIAGRLVSIASTFGLGIVVYYLLRLFNVDKELSVLFSLITVTSPFVLIWFSMARVDTLGLFLTLLGFYVFLSSCSMQNYLAQKRLLLSFFILSLATLSKQSFLSSILVVLGYLLYKRHFKLFVIGCFVVALPQLMLILFLPHYFEDVVLANYYQSLSFVVFKYGVFMLAKYYISLLILLLFSIAIAITHLNRNNARFKLLIFYLVVSWTLSLISYSKPGSSINYFLEPLTVSTVIIGIILENYWRPNKLNKLLHFVMLILMSVMLISYVHYNLSISVFYYYKLQDNQINSHKVYLMLQSYQKPILSESPYLAFESGKGPVIDLFILSHLAREHVWNQSKLVNNILHQQYSVIITMHPLDRYPINSPDSRYTPLMVNAILQCYSLNASYGSYYIYTPKKHCSGDIK